MRIGVITTFAVRVGGVEHYLDRVLGDLHELGHEVALLCAISKGETRVPIRIPQGAPRFFVDELGQEEAVRQLFAWKPDIVYAHGLDARIEEQIVGRVPSVYFPHNYLDTCISGSKAHSFPQTRPCDRVFGPGCLVRYFPRRCGGLSPLTMVRSYRSKEERLSMLPRYDAVITTSDHMRAEYMKHGVPASRIRTIPYTSTLPKDPDRPAVRAREASFRGVLTARDAGVSSPPPLRVLFAARMERVKGGEVLIESLPSVAKTLRVPIHAVLAGEGPARTKWEAKARQVCARHRALAIDLPGWLSPSDLRARMAESHLLAFPSLWPEPYGLSGLESLAHGLPVVAFAVGGVPEWLHDGVNGALAPGDPPTAAEFAAAMLRATRDAETYESLCEGALRSVEGRVPALHTRELLRCFESVLAARG